MTVDSTGPWVWVSAARSEASRGGIDPLCLRFDAHRRLRGPYTLTNQLLQQLVPEVWQNDPDLVARHEIEILTASPELRSLIPARLETLTSLAVPEEHTRFYSPARLVRLAHGLTDFLRAALQERRQTLALDVVNVAHADRTDREFLAAACRRLGSDLFSLRLYTDEPTLPEPLAGLAPERLVQRLAADPPKPITLTGLATSRTAVERARAYVRTECLSDDAELLEAYQGLPLEIRAGLHDERADALAARDEPSLRLGPIPFHRERGTDPDGAGVAALIAAMRSCLELGFYQSCLEFGLRARPLVNFADRPDETRKVVGSLAMAYMMQGRPERARTLFEDALEASADPVLHLLAYYGSAMIATRYAERAAQDHPAAQRWMNHALALSSWFPEPEKRAFIRAFNTNGLALVKVHRGELDAALHLVDEALLTLDQAVALDQHQLHRSVLRYNRAQVLAGLRRYEEAIADYSAVITADPHYSEYHLDRGNLYRTLGRLPEALEDYEQAIACSPPYPEAFANRAGTLLQLGRVEEALIDYDYILDIDPENVDAYLNRASVLLDEGQVEGAARDVRRALELAPESAELHCLAGSVALAEDRPEDAEGRFDRALQLAPGLVEAWSGRAEARDARGLHQAAVDDLTQALTLTDSDLLRFNRAVARSAAGDWLGAAEDYGMALELGDPDDPDLLLRRASCLLQADRIREAVPAGARG